MTSYLSTTNKTISNSVEAILLSLDLLDNTPVGQSLVKESNILKNRTILTWEHLATNAKTNGTSIATTGGTYLVYTYNSTTIYRFLSTAEDSNGYNVEDSFYATLTSGVLSDLIITRG